MYSLFMKTAMYCLFLIVVCVTIASSCQKSTDETPMFVVCPTVIIFLLSGIGFIVSVIGLIWTA